MITAFAPAKLNLGLRILERRPDGYHKIETIFVPLRLFDRLEISPTDRPGIRLDVDASGVPSDASNLAVRAALETSRALGVEPALAMRLEKRIPVAAGLGGGSSDAAAAILAVEALAGASLADAVRREIALRLGADVPFFLDPRPAIGRGIGERLEPIERVPELHWLLVRMPFELSTASVYREASAELTLPQQGSSIAALLGPAGVESEPWNDLETIAARRHPEIGQARRALEVQGAVVTGMSGSGPTVYGQFETCEAAESAAQRAVFPAGAEAIVTTSPEFGAGNWDWGWGVAKW